jgi:hypothetical protein
MQYQRVTLGKSIRSLPAVARGHGRAGWDIAGLTEATSNESAAVDWPHATPAASNTHTIVELFLIMI